MLSDGYLVKTYKPTQNSNFALDVGWNHVGLYMVVTAFTMLSSVNLATGVFAKRERIALVDGSPKSYYVAYGYSVCNPLLTELRNHWYVNGKKILPPDFSSFLTPISLAMWVAADGNSRGNSVELNVHGFSHDEQSVMVTALYDQLGLKAELQQDGKYHILVFDRISGAKLANLIRPYLHPCVLYKINHMPTDVSSIVDKRTKLGRALAKSPKSS